MKIDLYLYHPRQEEMPAGARQTERGGFDGLFVAESPSDPFQCLAVASPHTSRVTLGEHDLAFHGEYYQLDYLPAAMNPGPLDDGPPPLYLAALGPQMFEAAGAVADGALIHPIHTRKYLRTVAEPAIARGLAQSGRRREQFGLSATVLGIVDEDAGEAAREAVRRQFAFYASTPAYRPVLELHGWESLGDRLRGLVRRGAHDAMAAQVPDEIL